MALTLSDIGAVLKEVVTPELYNQLQKINLLFQKIRSDSTMFGPNNKIFIPAITGRHSGIYSVGEGVNPRAGKTKRQRMSTDIRWLFGTLEITDQTLTAARKGDYKAVVPILTNEIESLTDTMEKDINRQWHGDGTGQLCLTTSTEGAGATIVPVDTPGTEYIEEGMYVKIGSGEVVDVVSVDSPTQFTISASRTWTENDVIVKENMADMMGLKGIIDDGDFVATFQGLARGSNPWMNSYCDDTAETLAIAMMTQAYLKAQKYAKKGSKIVIFSNETLFAKYGNLLTATMHVHPEVKEILSGGWKGLDFMGGNAGIYLDYDVPEGFMQFTDLSSLIRAELTQPFEWLEGEGERNILHRSPTIRTNWEATMKYYCELVVTRLRANSRVSGKTAS